MSKDIRLLREAIDKAVENALDITRENNFDTLVESVVSKKLRSLQEDKESKENTAKKRSVIQWLQQPEVNTAEIRRKLEGEPKSQEDEDSKRSYFMKKVNQDYGKSFTSDEVNALYAIKSEMN